MDQLEKVRLGFFSFTEITDPSAHRAYNEWHQLDHMPEQFPLPGIAGGTRWVSTPLRRSQRLVDGDALGPVHYVTLYLMAEPVEQTLDDFGALGVRLHQEDRFFDARRAPLSGPFDVLAACAAPRVRVSAEALAFRPTTGVYVIVDAAGAVDPDNPADPADSGWRMVPEGDLDLVGVDGIAGVWVFASSSRAGKRQWPEGRHRITVCYLDGNVDDAVARLGPALAHRQPRPDGTKTILAGPFDSIVPWQWDWFEDQALAP